MIEKVLDEYYCLKLKKYLDRQLMFWFIDHRYKEDKNYLELQVKREAYNNKKYKEILTFNKQEIFTILCNQNELKDCLRERIDKYFEDNK